ncbi:hypothetical protein [Haloarchaeobius sp. DFWS5]|uniref:RPA family protein n=1 Tax=Haloarchaeobius sp. DFWS5 TaxID=3446114 RepID=UPI003EC0C6C8
MSASGIQRREVAYRLFATEFDAATLSYQESDEERAPNYVITPTGARVNRLFAVGVLTEVENVNEEVLRGRVVDPTGAFVVYAGQYQPDEMAVLESTTPPAFVAITGKGRTFSPDDSDRVFTSIRPESITQIDADTRDRWVVTTAEQTLRRIATFAEAALMEETGEDLQAALEARGVPSSLAAGIPLAMDHYGTTPAYLAGLRQAAIDAVRMVAGERDEVGDFSLAPADAGDGTATWASLRNSELSALGEVDASAQPTPEATDSTAAEAETEAGSAAADASAEADDSGVSSDDAAAASESEPEPEPESEPAETEPVAAADEPSDEDLAAAEPAASEGEPVDDEPASESEPAQVEVAASAEGSSESATVDTASEPESSDDGGIGDFEPGDLGGDSGAEDDTSADTTDSTASTETADAAVEDTGGMYEMDDEEREEIEAEFGTDFTSGSEVDDPGEAGIETPEPESATPEAADAEAAAEPEPEADTDTDESEADDAAAEEADEPAEDVDLDDYVIDVMSELDDGDGAARADVVEKAIADTGADEDAVDDAIQNALIGGHCYEPDDDTLKPI